MTKRKPYQTYPKAFKLEAIRLMESINWGQINWGQSKNYC